MDEACRCTVGLPAGENKLASKLVRCQFAPFGADVESSRAMLWRWPAATGAALRPGHQGPLGHLGRRPLLIPMLV